MLVTHWPSTSDKNRTWDYPYSRLHWTLRSFISEHIHHPLFSPHQCANPVFGFAFFTPSPFSTQTRRTFSGSIGRNCKLKYFVFIYQCSMLILVLLARPYCQEFLLVTMIFTLINYLHICISTFLYTRIFIIYIYLIKITSKKKIPRSITQ